MNTAAGQEQKLRVLVVDDNADAARALALLLHHYNCEVTVAFDGESAVILADDTHPQVAILDIGLPLMDGCEVARHIRRRPWGGDVRLIALSGWGQEADRARSRDAGIDVHLVKPADTAELLRLLDAVRPSNSNGSTHSATADGNLQ